MAIEKVSGKSQLWLLEQGSYQFYYDIVTGNLLRTMPPVTLSSVTAGILVTYNSVPAVFMLTQAEVLIVDQNSNQIIKKVDHTPLTIGSPKIFYFSTSNKIILLYSNLVQSFDLTTLAFNATNILSQETIYQGMQHRTLERLYFNRYDGRYFLTANSIDIIPNLYATDLVTGSSVCAAIDQHPTKPFFIAYCDQ
jgi:hypothetical protein